MKTVLSAISVILALVSPASAQERPIAPEVLLNRIDGRTMVFLDRATRQVVGYEQFLSRTKSQWRDENGKCVQGEIYVAGPTICFRYEDEPGREHCWLPFKDGSEIGYRSTFNGEVQLMQSADPNAADCEPVPLS